MASPDEQAVVRCAAMRVEDVISNVVGSLHLLVEQMGDKRMTPDRDLVSSWCSVVAWLSGRLEVEISNLADSLSHDELVAKGRRP